MIKDLTAFYSKAALNMKRSEIRELLKMTRQPDIISFAGGLPDPATFPVKDLEEISCQLLRDKGAIALQYGPTEGEAPLRQEIAKWMSREKATIKPENILITVGSQQGLDIIAKVFLDPHDIVIVEMPTYVGGLQAFNAYRARMIGVSQDTDGMRMDLLEKTLAQLAKRNKKPKFIYVVPDFQNPSGATLSLKRRRHLLDVAYQYEIPIVEDSPYRDLRFVGESIPAIHSLDSENHVIVLSTFSKLLCPGLRLAWIMAPAEWTDRMVVAKQSMDLCSPSYTQLIVAEYLRRGLLPKQIEGICKLYSRKLKIMLDALEKYMPKGVRWSKPKGGLFLWIELPKRMSANDLFPKAVENGVAYVVGSAFHCDGTGQNTMRINFSYPSEPQIVEGIQRLAEMLRANM
ncbi:aminotransferase class I/II-fold pyridoxal phosphate-dependent enzyme [Candidatus Bathyarchaeota archaeon]|nr:aminotransferase class I/II-fold pyridoxal phosphate-dependent enzyme [Candidatus Bathyarchaeota archaeon]NIV43738.1 aminotransferase class I/II-fold pyridoxal phosphate-dependent enzyme [Candidatus Bathyarchaeota archaeon]